MALASSRVIFSSDPVNTTVLPENGAFAFGRWRFCFRALGVEHTDVHCEPLDNAEIVLFGEIGGDAFNHGLADLVEGVHVHARLLVALCNFETGVMKCAPCAVSAGEHACRGVAD